MRYFSDVETYYCQEDRNAPLFHFLILAHHCYLILDMQYLVTKVKCSTCWQWINRSTFGTHIAKCNYCPSCKRTYQNEHECAYNNKRLTPQDRRERALSSSQESVCENWLQMKPDKKAQPGRRIRKNPLKKEYFADIEAYPMQGEENRFVPYAIAILALEDLGRCEPTIFYGVNCMQRFLKHLTQLQGILYYFNGSGFDNFLHIRGMIDYGYYIDNTTFVRCRGRIMAFNQHKNLVVHDLYLFIKSSLAKACNGWGVPLDESKKDFDHEKVQCIDQAYQHKEEVIEYLKYDVISLARLFQIYQKTMMECFQLNVNDSLTPAQFSLRAWSSTCSELEHLYIPHRGKEENDDRAAYYGGRVMCQYRQYKSEDYDEGRNLHGYNFADVDDYLVIGDVNSLYPSVQMKNSFAYGKWKYSEPSCEAEEEGLCRWLNFLTDTERLFRCMLKVDITCPKDLLTAFLMERGEDATMHHTLHDKKEYWIWGCEWQEAQILGYRVTRVYEIKEFEKFGPLFKSFVSTCWEGRKQSVSGSAKNRCFKEALNGLTGKFGQKAHLTYSAIYSTGYKPTPKTEQNFVKMLHQVVDFIPLFSQDGSNHSIVLEIENENVNPPYPIYLSAQILAYSRVYMSQIMRACGAYLQLERAIYYTDTDSLVMNPACLSDLHLGNYIGKELGQIKCDLNEKFTNNEFAKIIRGIWSATKGPYSLVYLLPDDNCPWEKVKMKGIPHSDAPFRHTDELKMKMDVKKSLLLERIKLWLSSPSTYELPAPVIGERFYLYQPAEEDYVSLDEKGEAKNGAYAAKHINFKMIEMMMKKEGTLTAFFGGMKKCFLNYDGKALLVKPDVVRRIVCRNDWWLKQKRVFALGEEQNVFALSLPPGDYEPARGEFRYDLSHVQYF